MKNVCFVGLGYIGLPSATLVASKGILVNGLDNNEHVVESVNLGKAHIVEPGVDDLLKSTVQKGTLVASTKIVESDCYVIAVPTPFKDNNVPDLSYVESAARSVAPALKSGDLVILESTSPVGTTEWMCALLKSLRPDLSFPESQACVGKDIAVAYCPERILPGKALQELVSNDRVIGGISDACSEKAKAFYEVFVEGELLLTTSKTAELVKLSENAFRDANIAFANELSLISDDLNVNVWDVIRLSNRHPRVNILNPGPGVGGHCIAVDPWFIVNSAPESSQLIKTARTVNDGKPEWVERKVLALASDVASQRPTGAEGSINIAYLGIAFKPDVDDIRQSPSLEIAMNLAKQDNVRVLAVEPNLTSLPANVDSAFDLVSLEQALSTADVVVVSVGHREFVTKSDLIRAHANVIDLVGLLEAK